jgi:hypothetical protein
MEHLLGEAFANNFSLNSTPHFLWRDELYTLYSGKRQANTMKIFFLCLPDNFSGRRWTKKIFYQEGFYPTSWSTKQILKNNFLLYTASF